MKKKLSNLEITSFVTNPNRVKGGTMIFFTIPCNTETNGDPYTRTDCIDHHPGSVN